MAYGILADFLYGQTTHAYEYFGAHFGFQDIEKTDDLGKKITERVYGVWFRLYCPSGNDVSVIGEFNGWDVGANKMEKIDDAGVFETFVPGLSNYQSYKYHFRNALGQYVDKADPFAFYSELRPLTCSRIFDIEGFPWADGEWMARRTRNFDVPMWIYEVDRGSWR